MTEELQEPPIEDILNKFIDFALKNTCVSCPGKITKVSTDRQFVQVQPLQKSVFRDKETGEKVSEDLPVINNVPLFMPQSQEFYISFPIKSGDLCLLIFTDRSLDEFLQTDGSQAIEAKDKRIHSLNDCIAFAGFSTQNKKINSVSSDDLVIGTKDRTLEAHLTTSGEFQVKGNAIRLGDLSGSKALAIAQKVNDRIAALENHFNTNVAIHTHISNGPALPTNPPLPSLGVTAGADVSSSKVFASD